MTDRSKKIFSRKKKLLFALTLLALASFFVLVAGEIIVRLTTDPPLYIADPILGSRLRSNVKTRYVRKDVDQAITTNSFGFHDQEYSLEKPANTRRILILGDSYMEALQVSTNETFAKVLQLQLNRQSRGIRVQTVNTGKSGRGVLEEYLVLRTLGWKFKPDLVLLAFVMNDVHDDANVASSIETDERGRPVRFKSEGMLSLSTKRLIHRSYFLYLLLERMSILRSRLSAREKAKDDHFDILRREYSQKTRDSWEFTKNNLKRINIECKEKGIPLLLMIIPAESQFDRRQTPTSKFWKLQAPSEKPQKILNELGKSEGFAVLDLLPIFKEIKDYPLHCREGHWNKKGHSYAAKATADFIIEQRLLQKIN